MPWPPRGVAATSKASGGTAPLPIMSVAAEARAKLEPASCCTDSASPRSVSPSRAPISATTAAVIALRQESASSPDGTSVITASTTGAEVLHRVLGDPPAVDHLPLARQAGVLGRRDRQRVAPPQLEDGPVDLGARTRGVVQGPLELVAEQRAELLPVAHAVGQGERLPQPLRAEVDRERRLGVTGRSTVGDPRCPQDPGDVGVLEGGCDHEAVVGRVVRRPVREGRRGPPRPGGPGAATRSTRPQAPSCRPVGCDLTQLVEPSSGQRRHPRVVAVRRAVQHLAGQPRPPLGRDGRQVRVRAAVGLEGLDVTVVAELVGRWVLARSAR